MGTSSHRKPCADASSRLPWGFTLLEVMVVLILVAALTAVVTTKVTDMGQNLTSTIEQLKVHIRYAQMRSINNVNVHGVCSDGFSYWLFANGNTGNRERFPGQSATSIALPSGIGMDSFTVAFDSRGIPYTDMAATTNKLAADSAAAAITVGGKAGAVRITPNTGYVRD